MVKIEDINSEVEEPLRSVLLGRDQVPYVPKNIEDYIKNIEKEPFTPDFKCIWIEVIKYLFSYENIYTEKSIDSKKEDAKYWFELALTYSNESDITLTSFNPRLLNMNILHLFDSYISQFDYLPWHEQPKKPWYKL